MNDTFLHLVARDLLSRFDHLNQVTLVFPGKRASLFMNQELARLSSGPVWAPRYMTIGDMFTSLSRYEVANPIDCICTLYQLFHDMMGPDDAETLDQFFSWGEIILSDFDDIDKHLADAAAVLGNVYELKQFDTLDYLEPEQLETLQHFFRNFDPGNNSRIKERFLLVWQHMFGLYSELKQRLADEGLAWEGAAFRQVAEDMLRGDEDVMRTLRSWGTVAFVGFNVLNQVEHTLLSTLQKNGQALFYWDYDVFYTRSEENEAGIFMRQNLRDFPSALPVECFDNLRHLKDVTFISTTTNNVQARYVHDWMMQGLNPQENRNAIVLCDETLMQPVLHALPDADELPLQHGLNVTMGFPLTDTPVYSYMVALFDLQTDGWDDTLGHFRRSFLQRVRQHPYSTFVSEEIWLVHQQAQNESLLAYLIQILECVGTHFASIQEGDVYEQMYAEGVFQCHRILNQFLHLLLRPVRPLQVETLTLRRLMRRVLYQCSIPFHGEPATGIQVMGVLETRCLDFSHIVMLSLEEGKLPRNSRSQSMIPANLREAFHLTTPRHRICIYSYYFYRLIQRSEHLTCVYNTNCEGTSRHEMSRFLLQLQVETNIPIRSLRVELPSTIGTSSPLHCARSPQAMQQLWQRYVQPPSGKRPSVLSPTAINSYLTCPMEFYLRYVAGIRVKEELTDTIDLPLMGVIFHDTMQALYTQLIQRSGNNQNITSQQINELLNSNSLIETMLDCVFDVAYFHPVDEPKRLSAAMKMAQGAPRPNNVYFGELIIVRRVLYSYICNTLRYDMSYAPFRIQAMEVACQLSIPISTPQGDFVVLTGGRIDRIDLKGDVLRIVDYKTGSPSKEHKKVTMDTIFQHDEGHNGYYLQTFLYSLAHCMEPDFPHSQVSLRPALLYASRAGQTDYDPTLLFDGGPIQDFTDLAEEYFERLQSVVQEIFDTDSDRGEGFRQCEEGRHCALCQFRTLCGR